MDAINYIAVAVVILLVVTSLIVVNRRSKRTDDPVRRHEDYLQRGEGDASARQAEGRRGWGDNP